MIRAVHRLRIHASGDDPFATTVRTTDPKATVEQVRRCDPDAIIEIVDDQERADEQPEEVSVW